MLFGATYLSILAIAGLTTAVAKPDTSSGCASLHMICARGSDEPPGEGIIGAVAYKVTQYLPNSDSIGLPYPATFAKYRYSEEDGVRNLTKLIEEYVEKCPLSKIGLLGYSQGAQVIGDTLYGNTEHDRFNSTKPLEMKYGKHIGAVVLMGDPTFEPGLPWDAGTSKRHGVFHRHSIAWAWPYETVTRSYCDQGDVYCARGRSPTAHLEYVNIYANQAAQFIKRSYHRSLLPGGGVDVSKAPKPKTSGKHKPNKNPHGLGHGGGPNPRPGQNPSQNPKKNPQSSPTHKPISHPKHHPQNSPTHKPQKHPKHHPNHHPDHHHPAHHSNHQSPAHHSGNGGNGPQNAATSLSPVSSTIAWTLIPLAMALFWH